MTAVYSCHDKNKDNCQGVGSVWRSRHARCFPSHHHHHCVQFYTWRAAWLSRYPLQVYINRPLGRRTGQPYTWKMRVEKSKALYGLYASQSRIDYFRVPPLFWFPRLHYDVSLACAQRSTVLRDFQRLLIIHMFYWAVMVNKRSLHVL